jgi:hydrogenase small subunit
MGIRKVAEGRSMVQKYPVVWLQCATCTGCSVSALNSVSPTIKNLLVDEVIPGKTLNLRYHATIMAGAGDGAIEAIERTAKEDNGGFVLIVEGAVPTAQGGIFGVLGERKGKPITMATWVDSLARAAGAVIALGTCAAFGGIAAGRPNPSGSVGVSHFFKMRSITTPLLNVPGCPPHPDWLVGTVASVMLNGLPGAKDLDESLRPRAFYDKTVHERCPRRAYFDEGKFARKFGEPGCLNELGCKGPVSHADCPLRLWNHGVNWCIGSGGLCLGCVEPGFPDLVSPMYEKMSETLVPTLGQGKRGE